MTWLDLLLLAKNGSQAADLGAQRGTDVLRGVGNQVFDRGDHIVKENIAVDESAETGYLTGNGGPDLGFRILQQPGEGGDQIPRDRLVIHSLGNLVTVSTKNMAEKRGIEKHTFSNRSAIM